MRAACKFSAIDRTRRIAVPCGVARWQSRRRIEAKPKSEQGITLNQDGAAGLAAAEAVHDWRARRRPTWEDRSDQGAVDDGYRELLELA